MPPNAGETSRISLKKSFTQVWTSWKPFGLAKGAAKVLNSSTSCVLRKRGSPSLDQLCRDRRVPMIPYTFCRFLSDEEDKIRFEEESSRHLQHLARTCLRHLAHQHLRLSLRVAVTNRGLCELSLHLIAHTSLINHQRGPFNGLLLSIFPRLVFARSVGRSGRVSLQE